MIGGSLTEVLSLVLAPAVTRRRDTWFKEVAEALEEAERKIDGFSVESLTQDEAFVSAVIEATRSAISTHKDEKRDALRNGLLNIALHRSTNEDQQQTFFRYIDELTVWHMRILKLFQNPIEQVSARDPYVTTSYTGGAPVQIIRIVYPELYEKQELYQQLVSDLYNRGLFNADSKVLHITMTADGMFAKRTTVLADDFLAFIANPIA
ncbi:MAG: hypothetical protein ACRYGF_15305 [Janthinobacterium lividum]